MAGFRRGRGNPNRTPISPLVKYVIFFINFLFMLIGIGATTVGTYVLVIKEKSVSSVIEFFMDPSCWLCLVGSVMVAVSFMGTAGSLRENICFLRIYYVSVGFFLFLQLAAAVLVFIFYYVPDARVKLGLYPESHLKDAIVKYRDDQDMQNFIDIIQQTLECCGLSNDDEGYKDWNLNVYFNCNETNKSPESCAVPFSCCKITAGDAINILCGGNTLKDVEVSNRIYTQGCVKGVQTWLDKYALTAGGITIGILLPQVLLFCMARTLTDQIQEQMAKW